MKLHLLGLPHAHLTRENSTCAYTQKTRKLSTMLHRIGIDVTLYSSDTTDAECKEHVITHTSDEMEDWFGSPDPNRVFNNFDPSHISWETMNERVKYWMTDRAEPGDILGITMGRCQQSVADYAASLGVFPVEVGIGYSGTLPNTFHVYESYAWMHHLAGRNHDDRVRFYDTVIPNFFETDDFPLGPGMGDFLFLGRIQEDKGIRIAAETCARLGARLIVAGQGSIEGMDLPGDVLPVGVASPKLRAELLGNAIATFCPSTYLEPFCGVSVESQLCGTPVISTDWGALTENVEQGVTGYRCSTLSEFAAAAELAPFLDRGYIRQLAQSRWSTDVLAYEYDRYFARLSTLRQEGWYS